MLSLLRLKAAGSDRFVTRLKASEGKHLIHNVESDSFWSCGPDLLGSNKLGCLLEDLREELLKSLTVPDEPSVTDQNPQPTLKTRHPELPPMKKVVVFGNSNARGIAQELLDRDVEATGITYPGTLNRLTACL